jgi:hypothetical protein
MPLLQIDRRNITRARATHAKQRDAQREARAKLQAAQTELGALRAQGANERTIARVQARIDSLGNEARTQVATGREQLQSIRDLSERLVIAQRDPSRLVEALDAQHPVLLLPVSIQTRYDDATTKLMIRIYPDVLHAFQHDPGLTPAELDDARRYWTQRFATPADSASPWKELSVVHGPMRAAYLVRMLTPSNVAQIGVEAEPAFDEAALPIAAAEAREVVAAALPPRFVAVGYRGGKEVLRKWAERPVADVLPMSALFDPLLVEDEAQWDPFAGDRAWLVNYDAAFEAGMAITVTAGDLAAGTTLAQGLDRLVVLGVDWTRAADDSAGMLSELLHNHQHGQGLAFVAQGTPTNNTAGARAGFAADASDVAPALDPVAADAQSAAAGDAGAPVNVPVIPDELAGAGARLQHLLGLPAAPNTAHAFDATLVPGGALREGATAGHMINALWSATLGYTLRYFWNPLDEAEALIDDDAIATLRAHAVRYLRPSGPFSALRVGNQPYGILPVAARGFLPRADSALERELHEALGWFRGVWEAAVPRVPTMARPAADTLHQLLSMQPWSVAKRFWQVAGPAAVANYPDIKDSAFSQRLMMVLMIADLLDKQPFSLKSPFLAGCAVRPKPHSLDAVAWVQRDPANPKQELAPAALLADNYIAALTALLSRPQADPRAALVAMQNAESLLAALLAFAADEELLASGRKLFYKHLDLQPLVSAQLKTAARHMRYAEYNGVDSATLVGDQFQLGHASAVMGLQLQGTTAANQSVAQALGAEFGKLVLQWPEHLRNVATFRESLEYLQQRSVGELDLALRTTLDCAAHRLDAWIGSLATKRLDQMRERTPAGVHVGAFGVVESLRPDSQLRDQRLADSMGYVHAPSLQQATTAAVLRSGHLANRAQAAGAFNIDLRSTRVRKAKALLEGIANGQSMAALLGYRFERALRDGKLSQHILDYRRRYPLRPTGAGPDTGEDIDARDVVDGVRLVDEYRKGGIDGVSPVNVPGADRTQIKPVIDALIDQLDAVSDLLVAESVHQLVGGNVDGSAAAMAALDKQARPPEPRVVDTPHSTRGYTQRVVAVMNTENAGAWAPLDDLPAQVEPRLNAWIARLLGDPARWVFAARVLRRVDTGERYDGRPVLRWDDAQRTLSASIDALGLSPLALILGSEPQQHGGQSAVQEKLAAVLGAQAAAAFPGVAQADLAVVIDAEAPAAAPAGSLGLVAFESFAFLIKRLLDKARALRRMDMVQARDGIETDATLNDGEFAGVDAAELTARLGIAEARAQAAIAALTNAMAALPPASTELERLDAIAALDPAAAATQALLGALQAALAQAEALGWRSALASRPAADANAQGEAVDPQDTLLAAYGRARALHDEVVARLASAPAPDGSERPGAQVRMAIERIRAILGKAFPVLPVFTLGGFAAEAAASLAQRATLLRGDDLAIAGWLPKLGCVHEPTGFLADVLTASEALGTPTTGADFKLLQTGAPDRPPPQRWGALPPDPADDLRGVVAVVAHAPGTLAGIAAADGLAGLFIDEWSEQIPATHETTGLSFHFDTPGARAPQSMLLAVPSDPRAENWTLDELLGVVDEALALARLRAVRPQDLQGLGLLLPGLFLSNNFHHDVPTVDFARLLELNVAKLRAAYGQNSAKSFMTMADGKLVPTE